MTYYIVETCSIKIIDFCMVLLKIFLLKAHSTQFGQWKIRRDVIVTHISLGVYCISMIHVPAVTVGINCFEPQLLGQCTAPTPAPIASSARQYGVTDFSRPTAPPLLRAPQSIDRQKSSGTSNLLELFLISLIYFFFNPDRCIKRETDGTGHEHRITNRKPVATQN